MSSIFVVPAAGRMVPDPDLGDVLPDAGREVSKSQYWMCRVRDADVVVQATPVRTVKPKEITHAG